MPSPHTPRFRALFAGYERAHGEFTNTGTKPNGKVEGSNLTVPGIITLEHIEKHLFTAKGPGIVSIPLTEQDKCWFAVIDIDLGASTSIPPGETKAWAEAIEQKQLPLIACRSKSGGTHLFLFLSEAEPAVAVVDMMMRWAADLGAGNAEIFPKQSARAAETDTGNGINLPYRCNEKRVAIDQFGREIGLIEFLQTAELKRCRLELYRNRKNDAREVSQLEESDPFFGGPPCLIHLHRQGGVSEGSRNELLFNVAVYLRKRYPDTWKEYLPKYNDLMCHPGVDEKEIANTLKSAGRKTYQFRCKQHPIAPHCRKAICLKQTWGVGQTEQTVDIVGLTFYRSGKPSNDDTVLVGFEVVGQRLIVEADVFFHVARINPWCWKHTGRTLTELSQARWSQYLNEITASADQVALPEDSGESGILWSHIETFLTQRMQAVTLDEVRLGKPFREGEYVLFKLMDLDAFLKDRRENPSSTARLTNTLKDHDAVTEYRVVAGKKTRIWKIPLAADVPVATVNPIQITVEQEF